MSLLSNRKSILGAIVVGGIVTVMAFQNCAKSSAGFSSLPDDSQDQGNGAQDIANPGDGDSGQDPKDVACVDFQNSTKTSALECAQSEYGVQGALYYLVNKGDPRVTPTVMYDKNDQPVPFDVINSTVNTILERGYRLETDIKLSQLSVPTIKFTKGFQVGENQFLSDNDGKILIEAFAIDVRSNLVLESGREAGTYEIALLSDDGSILEMNLNGSADGTMQVIVDNDKHHPTGLKCGTQAFELTGSSKIPMRLRYFQGPRDEISLTLLMRKLNNPAEAGKDSFCKGAPRDGNWFKSATTTQYPNYENSRIGEMLKRGWFIPGEKAFLLK